MVFMKPTQASRLRAKVEMTEELGPLVGGFCPAVRPKIIFSQRRKLTSQSAPAKSPGTRAKMSMITATTWVPRGFAAPFPSKYVFDEDEYERIAQLAKLQLDDAKEDLEEARDEKKKAKSSSSNGAAGTKSTEYDDMPSELFTCNSNH
jgi:hypothetical protein